MPPLNDPMGSLFKDRLSAALLGLVGSLGLSSILDYAEDPANSQLTEFALLGESSSLPVTDFSPRSQCSFDLPYSCTNNTDMDLDLCCFEYPGGVVLLTQFWDYSPATGPNDSFTLHGLWPDNCDGTFEQFCDSKMEISDPASIIESYDTDLLDYMSTYWKDNRGRDAYLWKHEFNKHGTCYSTLKPSCYGNAMSANQNVVDFFNQSVNLFKDLPTYDWLVEAGITPSETETYSKEEILAVLSKNFGATPYIRCDTQNALLEVWYFHHLRGPVVGGSYLPIESLTNSRCPSQGIRFPPKVPDLKPTHTLPGPRPTDPSTRGFIKLSHQQGCLIRNGHWYVSGACAGYSIEMLNTGSVHLKSSGGYCTIHEGGFTCGANISPFEFDFDPTTKMLSANGQITFSADDVPRGKIQKVVHLGPGEVEFNLLFVPKYDN